MTHVCCVGKMSKIEWHTTPHIPWHTTPHMLHFEIATITSSHATLAQNHFNDFKGNSP